MLKKLLELYQYRELIKIIVSRNLKVRYRSSVLGYAWTWLDPLMMMFIFILVFDVLFESGIKNFALYLLCALIPWTFFQNTTGQSVSSITDNAGLIKRIYYPREIFPLTIMLTHGVTMLLSLVVLILVVLAFGIPITTKILLFPIIVIFFFLFTFGLSLIFSTMNVFMRDIRHIVPLILRLLFYGTPIFYAVENRVPDRILDIYMFVNPLAVILNLFRSMFMNYYVPKPIHIAFALVDCIMLFLVGYVFFKKNEDLMVKRI